MTRRFALAVLLTALLVAAVGTATATVPMDADPPGDRPSPADSLAIDTNATEDPGPPGRGVIRTVRTFRATEELGTVAVELSYETGAGVERAQTVVPNRYTILDSGDFTRETNDEGQTVLRWDGTPANPSATLRYRVNKTGEFGWDAVDTGEWALLEPGWMSTRGWWSRGVEPKWEVHNRVAGEGYAGPRLVYLGPYDLTWDTSVYSQVKVVVPAAVERTNESAVVDAAVRTADFFGEAGITRSNDAYNTFGRTTFVGGNETRGITAFVGPEPFDGGGYTVGSNVLLRLDDRPTFRHRTLVYHEFTHTVQAWQTAPSAQWLTEGAAEFYEHRLAWRFGDYSFHQYRQTLGEKGRTAPANAVLSDPGTWRGTEADYDKGSVVYAALDARIRNATGGERTVDDLTRRLNDHDGNVTNADLKRMAEATAGRDLDAFFRRYVAGAETPPVPTARQYAAGGSRRTEVDISVTTRRLAPTRVAADVRVTNTGDEPLALPAVALEPSSDRIVVAGSNLTGDAPDRVRLRTLAPGETRRVSFGLTGDPIAAGTESDLRVRVENPVGEDVTHTATFRTDPTAGRETVEGDGGDAGDPMDDDGRSAAFTAAALAILGFGGLATLFGGLGVVVLVGRGLDSVVGVVPAAVTGRSPRWFGKWALLLGVLTALAFGVAVALN